MPEFSFNWTCPFCNRDQTSTNQTFSSKSTLLTLSTAISALHIDNVFFICANPECKRFTFWVDLYETNYSLGSGHYIKGDHLNRWRLVPPSEAKSFPDYVPQAIRDDYTEACLTRDLSPKASATLSRRCLQGMIRDFWNVEAPNLYREIEAIKDKVDSLTWRAINAVRGIGNIGAHMEKDINLIVEVEPDEATQLIALIEMLMKEWYINRHERQQQLEALVTIGEAKKNARRPDNADE